MNLPAVWLDESGILTTAHEEASFAFRGGGPT